MGDIQFIFQERRGQTLVGRNPVKGNSRRWFETGGAPVAHFLASLHVPVNLVLRHSEVVFENASNPERRSLLIFRHPQPFVPKVFGLPDAGVEVIGELGLEQAAAWKYR